MYSSYLPACGAGWKGEPRDKPVLQNIKPYYLGVIFKVTKLDVDMNIFERMKLQAVGFSKVK